jgi:hypothetical protein
VSRVECNYDCDTWEFIRGRGAVKAALRGARGQAALKELAVRMDAMPVKELIANDLKGDDGGLCALGVLGEGRGIDLEKWIGDDSFQLSVIFDIAPAMIREIVYENDECMGPTMRPVTTELMGPVRMGAPEYGSHQIRRWEERPGVRARRWSKMRAWVQSNIIGDPNAIQT